MRAQINKNADKMRAAYHPGMTVKIISRMANPRPVPPGTKGVIMLIDDAGQVHVSWETGRTLALLPGIDEWEVVKGTDK